LDNETAPHLQEGVVAASVFVHQSVERTAARFYSELRRPTYVTPASYLELLNTFRNLLGEKRTSIETTRSRLAVGLDKLLSTAEQVAHMQVRSCPCCS
jgi:dynein heavy chain, axonemal